jgi:chemotaxis protein MotB
VPTNDVAAPTPPVTPLQLNATPPASSAAAAPAGDTTTVAEATIAAMQTLDAEIAEAVERTMADDASPQLSIKATSEGILINLTDDADFSMFEVGSAIPNAKVVVLMEEIARVLKGQAGDVVIRGHTDARPFRSDAYDNWRLSAARAHMAYYMLTRGGLDESRVITIEGYAERSLKNTTDPYAAENRRIEILLRDAK